VRSRIMRRVGKETRTLRCPPDEKKKVIVSRPRGAAIVKGRRGAMIVSRPRAAAVVSGARGAAVCRSVIVNGVRVRRCM